ncbi:MAG TPA: NERD domain-containing protein/DEAD/DEAH box helicase [Euzebya sp.]|nr:NERD domain-containing protein/DEAD/DEAH box helicase [Euzebya sp.]
MPVSPPRWSPETSPSEQLLYDRIREALGEEVAILPQVMLSVGERGRLQEAEADLVLVDPSHGVIVIEVKGGTLSYDARQAIWRRREAGMAEVRDPVAQVKRARSIIRQRLKDQRLPVEEIPIRWVVATPDCRIDSPGEGVLPRHLLWDAASLADLPTAVHRAQGRMVDGEHAVGQVRADAIVRALRGRSVEGIASDAATVAAHDARVHAFTESHRNVMHQFLREKRVLVRGAAGTGKTMLAIEVAAMYASQGQRVLLTCWHRLLAVHLRRRLHERLAQIGSPAATEVTADIGGTVVAADLASLVVDAGTAPKGEGASRWYYEDLPERLGQWGVAGEFDVIVLDEAQDPNELWLTALAGLLRDDGRWYAFADRQQDLFGTAAGMGDFVDVAHELKENFRNSVQIADFAALFGDVETDCLTGLGPPIRYERVPADRVVGRVPELARKLCRDEGFAKSDVAALWLYHNPWQGQPEGLIGQDERGEMVTTNSAAFKGMERRVVVLGLDVRADRSKQDLLRSTYAAATRARSLLVVVGDPDQLRQHELYTLAAMFKTGPA